VRPLPGAPVSMPLRWSEVNGRLDIRNYTIRNTVARMKKLRSDPLLPVLTEVPDLLGALAALQARS
jgi:bifunctional non-homologous end joining protein LigD